MGELYRVVPGRVFRGDYSAAQVKYIFNFEPLTNGRPYFAGYTKSWGLSPILKRLDSLSDEWGYLLVWATLLISCFFGVGLLTVPVLSGWRTIFSRQPGKMGTIIYFICPGMGYIAVEIVYTNKCIICLGNPAVSFAVIVTGMVLFSGVGSYVSGKLISRARSIVPVFCTGIAVVLIGYAFSLDRILTIAAVWPYAAKVLFCLVLLLPLAFLLGFPFAMGMAILSKAGREHFFVWAWGINGSFSVLGSVMVPVMTVNWGFFDLLLLCAALYLAAIPCFFGFQSPRRGAVAGQLLLAACFLLVSVWPCGAGAAQEGPAAEGISFVAPMTGAPFPYDGNYDDTGQNFFDLVEPTTGERFHTNRYGQRFSETGHYSDNSVLFHLPPNFTPKKPFAFLIFFHGINSDIHKSDREYQIAGQVGDSGTNVILILPQLAVNAADSSPGKFFKPDAFKYFMLEASEIIASRIGRENLPALSAAPIFLSAFSGGYKTAAYVLDRGGEPGRIKGVFLVDALYEDLDKFVKWIKEGARDRFFIAIYTQATEMNASELAGLLSEQGIKAGLEWPGSIVSGSVNLIRSSSEHLTVPLLGPPVRPISHFLGILDSNLFEPPGAIKNGSYGK